MVLSGCSVHTLKWSSSNCSSSRRQRNAARAQRAGEAAAAAAAAGSRHTVDSDEALLRLDFLNEKSYESGLPCARGTGDPQQLPGKDAEGEIDDPTYPFSFVAAVAAARAAARVAAAATTTTTPAAAVFVPAAAAAAAVAADCFALIIEIGNIVKLDLALQSLQ